MRLIFPPKISQDAKGMCPLVISVMRMRTVHSERKTREFNSSFEKTRVCLRALFAFH